GTELVPFQVARNPMFAPAPGARLPFQVSLCTVTPAPTWSSCPPQYWVTCWPSVKVNATSQPVIGEVPVLVTLTSAWNPPCHSLITWYAASQPPGGGGGGSVVGSTVGSPVGSDVGPVVGGVVGGGLVGTPSSTAASAGYQRSAIFWIPDSFGWTPS